MAAIQLLVVEDDFLAAENICAQIKKIGFEVTAVVDNGKEAIQQVIKNQPDLAIMDIRIKGEMDGIETAAQLASNYDIPIIYLTDQSDKETYERAKDTHPHAFLSKPVTALALQRSIELAIIHVFKEQKEKGDELLKGGKVFHKHFMLKEGNSLYSIKLEDIEWLKADGSYCELKTKESKWTISRSMGTVLENLQQTTFCKNNIIRISRSVSVNIKKVESISGNKVLVAGEEFTFGDTYRDLLFEHIQTV